MGAADVLFRLMASGIRFEVVNEKIVVRPADKLTDDDRHAIRANKPELLQLLSVDTKRRHRLTKADASAAHAKPWGDAAIGLFTARVVMLMRRGFDATDADDLAERLHLRDERGDDRRMCIECIHLDRSRCGNARAAGVGFDVPTELVMQLQRCPGYGPVI
jgi:hypothetical protein